MRWANWGMWTCSFARHLLLTELKPKQAKDIYPCTAWYCGGGQWCQWWVMGQDSSSWMLTIQNGPRCYCSTLWRGVQGIPSRHSLPWRINVIMFPLAGRSLRADGGQTKVDHLGPVQSLASTFWPFKTSDFWMILVDLSVNRRLFSTCFHMFQKSSSTFPTR